MKLKDIKDLPLEGPIVLYDAITHTNLTVINQPKDKPYKDTHKPLTDELQNMEVKDIRAGYKYETIISEGNPLDFYPAIFIGIECSGKDPDWFKQWRV